MLVKVHHVAARIFRTGAGCLSATDNAGAYAPPWASKVVFRQPAASWAHACPADSLVIDARVVYADKLDHLGHLQRCTEPQAS